MDKKAILKGIQAEFESVGVTCDWMEEGEASPVDLLITAHEGLGFFGESAMGEYFFMHYDRAAEDTEYFVCMISTEEEVTTENPAALIDAVNRLNYYIPYGSFMVTPENEVMLKMCSPISGSIPQEAAAKQINTLIAHALDLFQRRIGLLSDVAAGKVTPEEVDELF